MSTSVLAPRATRPSLLAAALVLTAFGIYVGWTMSDAEGVAGVPWALLLAGSLVLPPWGLCQLVGIVVRRRGRTVARLGAVLDAASWVVGTVVSGLAFSLAYETGFPDLWTVLLFLAYSVPAYLLAALVRAAAGARRFGHVARLLAVTGLAVASLTLALRVVVVLAS